jgi:hypothetical protein
MVIAVPTGIKIWASVRVCEKLHYINDNRVESIENHSAYFDSVMIGGQQPALRRVMRRISCICSKIRLKVIGLLRMRLNCQSLSCFGSYSACPWFSLLHGYSDTLVVKIYIKGYSYIGALLIAFRTYNEKTSLIITRIICNSYKWTEQVSHATGEVLGKVNLIKDGRGFVVAVNSVKGPKHLNNCGTSHQLRSYSTRSRTNKLAPVQEQSEEISKDLLILAKH